MSKIELHTAISFLDGILSVNSIPDAPRALNGLQLENGGTAVSYTHLTLPTICSV